LRGTKLSGEFCGISIGLEHTRIDRIFCYFPSMLTILRHVSLCLSRSFVVTILIYIYGLLMRMLSVF
jgi:hypothetical protein